MKKKSNQERDAAKKSAASSRLASSVRPRNEREDGRTDGDKCRDDRMKGEIHRIVFR